MTRYPITICGIGELAHHADRGVSHVLSILDPGTPEPDSFGIFGEHARLDLRFEDIIDPLENRAVPTAAAIEAILGFGRRIQAEAATAHLLVHCYMGVSRSTAATVLLMAQADPAAPADAILAEIARLRSQAWPNLLMIEFGDALLRRGGSLVAATHAHYRRQVERSPELRGHMALSGRMREVRALYPPEERFGLGDADG